MTLTLHTGTAGADPPHPAYNKPDHEQLPLHSGTAGAAATAAGRTAPAAATVTTVAVTTCELKIIDRSIDLDQSMHTCIATYIDRWTIQ